jgi:signal transduction histidine kinase
LEKYNLKAIVGLFRALRTRTKLLLAGLALSILFAVVLLLCAYRIADTREANFSRVQSSFRLMSTVDRIYFHFLEAETCVARQPGDPAYQRQMAQLYAKLRTDLDELGRLVNDRPDQASGYRSLELLITKRRNSLLKDATTSYQRGMPVSNDGPPVLSTILTPYTARVRGITERMKNEEYRLLQADAGGDADTHTLFYSLGLPAGLGLVALILLASGLLLAEGRESRNREQQLQELNFNKDKFFSIVSHDLRGPAANVLKLSEFLMEETTPEDRKVITGHLYSSAQGLHKLLENLLGWARLQMGRVEVNPVPVNLYQAVQESIAQAALQASGKNIVIRNAVTPEATACVDEQMCAAVLRNLLQNAVKFTHPGGSVVVEARPAGTSVALLVSDTGVGMPAEVVNRLFHLGTHFSSRGTANESGSGLGLILCRELVEKNNGVLSVTSQPGKGTTFTVTLPTG